MRPRCIAKLLTEVAPRKIIIYQNQRSNTKSTERHSVPTLSNGHASTSPGKSSREIFDHDSDTQHHQTISLLLKNSRVRYRKHSLTSRIGLD
jgi:hypothetical protein